MESFVEEALQQARTTLKVYEQDAKESAASLRFLIKHLEAAQRIRLLAPLVPDGPSMESLATIGPLAQAIAHPLDTDLAIEYEHGGLYDVAIDPTRALSTRRIVLVVRMETEWAVTLEGAPPRAVDPHDRGALLLWSINYFEEKLEWEFAPSAVILPRAQAFEFLAQHGGRASLIKAKLFRPLETVMKTVMPNLDKSRFEAGNEPVQVLYQDMIPEIIRKLDPDVLQRMTRDMAMDACWAALGTMSAMACCNVRLDVAAGVAGNAKTLVYGGKLGSNNFQSPADPFKGRVEHDWSGAPLWRQDHRGVAAGAPSRATVVMPASAQ